MNTYIFICDVDYGIDEWFTEIIWASKLRIAKKKFQRKGNDLDMITQIIKIPGIHEPKLLKKP